MLVTIVANQANWFRTGRRTRGMITAPSCTRPALPIESPIEQKKKQKGKTSKSSHNRTFIEISNASSKFTVGVKSDFECN